MRIKVYIGGGTAPSGDEQTVIVYDPEQDIYSMLLPYENGYFSMAVVNSQLVLVGGMDVRTERRTNELGVWNEQSRIWMNPLPPMTIACNSPSVATHSNRWLVVMGGYDGENYLSRVEFWTPLSQDSGDEMVEGSLVDNWNTRNLSCRRFDPMLESSSRRDYLLYLVHLYLSHALKYYQVQ